MPFKFGLRRSKTRQSAANQSNVEHGVSKGQASLVGGPKDEQYESSGAGVRPNGAVLQAATAHGAAPAVVLETKRSLFRRTISSLSLRAASKASADCGAIPGRADATANGNRSGELADGAKQAEIHAAAEADPARRTTALHNLLPRFHGTHHQHVHAPGGNAQEGSTEQGTHPSHMPIHLPHLHLPHILESKSHHPATHHDVLSGVENPAEVMKVLEEATEHAKRIIEIARTQREALLGRARAEAEEEIKALRLSLERESLKVEDQNAAVEESLRVAAAEEDNLTRQHLEASQENVAASVTLCVDYVLNVDTSIAPDRRNALRNLKKNPPNFFRKSQAHNYPTMRSNGSAAARPSRVMQSFNFSDHSWDLDPREYTAAGGEVEPRATVYAAILGQRTFTDEDELQIDFDELERPSTMRRLSTALQKIQGSCGCFM